MRFAISLLTIIGIASMIGTVLKQNEPFSSYLNQFGPFWFPVFERLGLFSVYNAGWFLAILAFLVVSTSLCLWRNAPSMLREMRAYREELGERSLARFSHKAELSTARDTSTLVQSVTAYLSGAGFSHRARPQESGGVLVAGKAGSAHRLGYIAAHSGIVVICLGGLLDSELPLKLTLLFGDKQILRGTVMRDQVPPSGRLSTDNWSFRGNMLLAEGGENDIAVLNVADGVLVQDLPFKLRLNRFTIDHYSTGQPKLFASDITVTDKITGRTFDHRIEVNHPLTLHGITVYQASFDDGGTNLALRGLDLHRGRAAPLAIEGRVGETAKITYRDAEYAIELTGFRPTNVENVATGEAREEKSLLDRLSAGVGAAASTERGRTMRNVGPSFLYKLRDAAGQAREYHNYMLPVQIDSRWYYLSGMRENPNESFRFLRMPLDEDASFDSFLQLRTILLDNGVFAEIGARFARGAAGPGDAGQPAELRARLEETVVRVLETFTVQGMRSVAEFLEKAVPESEREKAADIYLRLLQGAAWEAWQFARERAGKAPLEPSPERARFVQDSLNAISDSFFYGVPLYLQLLTYDEVKASVFQLTRSPGRNIVYLGCLLLVLGIFALLYIRERRIWVLVRGEPSASAGPRMTIAMSSNRHTLDLDREFARHREALAGLAAAKE